MPVVSGNFVGRGGKRQTYAVPAPRSGQEPVSTGQPAPAASRDDALSLRMTTSLASPDAVVLHASGEIAERSAQRLKEAMRQCVRSDVSTLVLDLTEVSFLSVAGLRVMATMKQCATLNRTQFVVVTGPNPAVVRPLRAAAIAGAQLLVADHGSA